MILAWAFLDAGDGFLEELFTNGAHLSEESFQSPMISDGYLIERRLFCGDRQADGLGAHFTRHAPGVRRLRRQAALGDPTQGENLLFEFAIAFFESVDGLA